METRIIPPIVHNVCTVSCLILLAVILITIIFDKTARIYIYITRHSKYDEFLSVLLYLIIFLLALV